MPQAPSCQWVAAQMYGAVVDVWEARPTQLSRHRPPMLQAAGVQLIVGSTSCACGLKPLS